MTGKRLAIFLLACGASACGPTIDPGQPIQITLVVPLPEAGGPCVYTDAFSEIASVRVRALPNGVLALMDPKTMEKKVSASDFASKGIPTTPPWKVDFPQRFCRTKLECDAPSKPTDLPGFLVVELAGLDASGTVTHFAKTGQLRVAKGTTQIKALLWFAKTGDNGAFACTKGDLSKNRERHTATLLHSGEVAIIGGRPLSGAGSAVTEIEVYDPQTGEFTTRDDAKFGSTELPAVFDHTATLLNEYDIDGKLITSESKLIIHGGCIAGDKDTCTNALKNIYRITVDHSTKSWRLEKVSEMNHLRARTAATLLFSKPESNARQSKVLVSGGVGEGTLISGEVCDADLLSCNDKGFSASFGRQNLCAAQFVDPATLQERVLLVCGNKSTAAGEMFEDSTFKTTQGSLAAAREGCRCGMVGSKVFIAGGICDAANQFAAQVETFDFATNQFQLLGSMGGGEFRINHTATSTLDRFVLITGGSKGTGTICSAFDTPVDSAILVDATGGSQGEAVIKTTPPLRMRSARQRHRATQLDDGTILLTGGAQVATGGRGTAEIFTPPVQ